MSRLQEALYALQARSPRPPARTASKPHPTGVPGLDALLGTGGWPRGRVIEVFGPPGVGKTTLALHAALAGQKTGLTAALLDLDRGLDVHSAVRIGVDPRYLLIGHPADSHEALRVVHQLALSGAVGVIILDSADLLGPTLLRESLRALESAAWRGQTTLLLTNQLRRRPELRWGRQEETPPGGDALKHVVAQRLELTWRGPLLEAGVQVGHHLQARVVQNQFGLAERRLGLTLRYADGALQPSV